MTLMNVGHRFANRPWLFRGLDTELIPGRIYALTGPSGSGKSTLLSILAGWMPPAEGAVVTDSPARVSWVFQNPHGVARRTAVDHVALPYLATGMTPDEADARALEQLQLFGLDHVAERPFRELSGGEAQRLMLARGLATRPGRAPRRRADRPARPRYGGQRERGDRGHRRRGHDRRRRDPRRSNTRRLHRSPRPRRLPAPT